MVEIDSPNYAYSFNVQVVIKLTSCVGLVAKLFLHRRYLLFFNGDAALEPKIGSRVDSL